VLVCILHSNGVREIHLSDQGAFSDEQIKYSGSERLICGFLKKEGTITVLNFSYLHVNTIVISSTIAEQACATLSTNQYTSEFVKLYCPSPVFPVLSTLIVTELTNKLPTPFMEAKDFLLYISKDIPYRVFKSPPLDYIPNHINPVHILMSYVILWLSMAVLPLWTLAAFSVF
jgi:hypothetical protein